MQRRFLARQNSHKVMFTISLPAATTTPVWKPETSTRVQTLVLYAKEQRWTPRGIAQICLLTHHRAKVATSRLSPSSALISQLRGSPAVLVSVSTWPLVSCWKEEKILLGKPFINIYGKPFSPFKIKAHCLFLFFHTSPSHTPNFRWLFWEIPHNGQSVCTLPGKHHFFPFGNMSNAFFGKHGRNCVVWWCFLSAGFAVSPALF